MCRRALALAAVAVLALVETGCMVSVRHVSDAGGAFRAARAEAERLQGRPGPAHRINVLVFEPEERKLVKVSLPMWLARRIERRVDWGQGASRYSGARLARKIRVDDLDDAGLGVLADVEEDDGSQVLVWLR